jgi:carboxypeptidase C (cathepsin A)
LILAIAMIASQAVAQEAAHPAPAPGPATGSVAASSSGQAEPARSNRDGPRPMPAESVTHHTLELSGRTLHFTATAGAIRLVNRKGEPQADLVATAYTLDGADPAIRPVTLAVNGGPGSSTAWLQLGAVGPWRLPMDGTANSPSAPPIVQPNAETWLDFTDLVFFDPPGTGFSRIVASGDDASKHFYSVNGDIQALAEAQRRWLQKTQRLTSPKFILGESYGGFRGPRLVRVLLESQGVGIRGLIMVSPILDFGGRSSGFDPIVYVERLPSMVAAAREAHGPVDRAGLADVEAYAAGPYLADLLKGNRDPEAVARVSDKVAELTGLDPVMVRRHRGQIDYNTWLRERLRAKGEVASPYDSTVTTADPYADSSFSDHPDPILDGLRGPVTSAMVDLYTRRLNWLPDGTYELLNDSVATRWDYGHSFYKPESLNMLRAAIALDPQLQVLIAHGLTDIVTPYFATQLELNSFSPAGPLSRVKLDVFPGGHMFYARDASRVAFREAAQALYRAP